MSLFISASVLALVTSLFKVTSARYNSHRARRWINLAGVLPNTLHLLFYVSLSPNPSENHASHRRTWRALELAIALQRFAPLMRAGCLPPLRWWARLSC